jgi:uncharacterized repeat protein (TIGR02543 family)
MLLLAKSRRLITMYQLEKRTINKCILMLPIMVLSLLLISCSAIQGQNSGSTPEQSKSTITEQTYEFKIEAGEGGTIPAGGEDILDGRYKEGSEISIEVRSMPGYYFTNWTSSNGGKFADSNDSTTTFTMPGNDTVVTAHFAPSGHMTTKIR